MKKKYGKENNNYLKSKIIVNRCRNIFKVSTIMLIVSIIVSFVVPSKETMYTMLVSDMVTYDNVESVTDTIKDSVDYIFDKINEKDSN